MVQDFPPLLFLTNNTSGSQPKGNTDRYVPLSGAFCLNLDVQDELDCLIFFSVATLIMIII